MAKRSVYPPPSVGQVFGRLTAIGPAGRSEDGRLLWECECSCGNRTIAHVKRLYEGRKWSCGCAQRDALMARNVTHGQTKTMAFRIWCNLRNRCMNPRTPAYQSYGARGITVCARWLESFDNFLADMGSCPSPQHSIDRIDGRGNYEPGNCRWATALEQARNTRRNIILTFNGETMCLTAWAERTGIPSAVLRRRVRKYGWPVDRALTEQLRTRFKPAH